MECQFDFSLSDQRLVRTGFLLCLPCLLAASLDTQGYSVNDIIHILMAEGGQV